MCIYKGGRGGGWIFEWFDIAFSSVGLSVPLKVFYIPAADFLPQSVPKKWKKQLIPYRFAYNWFIAWQNVFCVKSTAVESKFEAFCYFPISLCERTNLSFFMLEWVLTEDYSEKTKFP